MLIQSLERTATGEENLQLFPTPSSDPNEPLVRGTAAPMSHG